MCQGFMNKLLNKNSLSFHICPYSLLNFLDFKQDLNLPLNPTYSAKKKQQQKHGTMKSC